MLPLLDSPAYPVALPVLRLSDPEFPLTPDRVVSIVTCPLLLSIDDPDLMSILPPDDLCDPPPRIATSPPTSVNLLLPKPWPAEISTEPPFPPSQKFSLVPLPAIICSAPPADFLCDESPACIKTLGPSELSLVPAMSSISPPKVPFPDRSAIYPAFPLSESFVLSVRVPEFPRLPPIDVSIMISPLCDSWEYPDTMETSPPIVSTGLLGP
mmetsp:Transcript_30863/g.65022  ORF Transcript_30863/g.65022 Transcript_30863/m.65022 type:complete len:211 (+) Transcript_30863:1160-1792(+)